jgi:hypothetical protein
MREDNELLAKFLGITFEVNRQKPYEDSNG